MAMGVRTIIVRIDDLMELFKDYTKDLGDIPEDAQAIKLMVKPTEMGKFAIVAESEAWAHGLPPIVLNFGIKRLYGVTG